jgi:hypothetical protein
VEKRERAGYVPLKVKKSTSAISESDVEKKSCSNHGNEDDIKAVRTAIDFEARDGACTKLEEGSDDPKKKLFLITAISKTAFLSLRDTKNF